MGKDEAKILSNIVHDAIDLIASRCEDQFGQCSETFVKVLFSIITVVIVKICNNQEKLTDFKQISEIFIRDLTAFLDNYTKIMDNPKNLN